jgi:hypothetical protein
MERFEATKSGPIELDSGRIHVSRLQPIPSQQPVTRRSRHVTRSEPFTPLPSNGLKLTSHTTKQHTAYQTEPTQLKLGLGSRLSNG